MAMYATMKFTRIVRGIRPVRLYQTNAVLHVDTVVSLTVVLQFYSGIGTC